MANFRVGLIMIIIVVLWAILVPLLLGIYTYRDSKARGMDSVLWTLIVLLVPSGIGLIIYLLVRKSSVKLSCPRCSGEVLPDYMVCPRCGQTLTGMCPSCSSPVDTSWKNCPHCGCELPSEMEVTRPVITKGKSDRWLLVTAIVLIILPMLLIFAAIPAAALYSSVTDTYQVDTYQLEGDRYINSMYVNAYEEANEVLESIDVYAGKTTYSFETVRAGTVSISGDSELERLCSDSDINTIAVHHSTGAMSGGGENAETGEEYPSWYTETERCSFILPSLNEDREQAFYFWTAEIDNDSIIINAVPCGKEEANISSDRALFVEIIQDISITGQLRSAYENRITQAVLNIGDKTMRVTFGQPAEVSETDIGE